MMCRVQMVTALMIVPKITAATTPLARSIRALLKS